MRKARAIWLLITFSTIVICPTFFGWYIQEHRNTELTEQLSDNAKALQDKKNYDGALNVYDFIIDHGLDDENQSALKGKTALETEMNAYSRKFYDAIKGFITGNIENTASMIGCVAGDVCLWGDIRDFAKNTYRYYSGEEIDKIITVLSGDIRDFAKNTYRYYSGEEVDKIITALSVLGIATTLIPEIDVGIAICKGFAKFMSSGLRKFLLVITEEAVKLRKYDKVSEFMTALTGMYKKIGSGIIDVLQLAKDSKEFAKYSEIIEKTGRSGYAFLMLGGRGAYKFLETTVDLGISLTGQTGKRIMTFALKYPTIGIRILKISKKIGWDNLDITLVALSELLASIPVKITFMICLAIWIWCYLVDLMGVIWWLLKRKSSPVA